MNPLLLFAMIPSWLYKWIGIGLAVVAIFVYVDRKATYRERAKCEAAAREAERKAGVQDQKADTLTRKDETDVSGKLLTQDEADRQTLRAVDDAIAKARSDAAKASKGVPVPSRCSLSDDDARRL